MFNDIKWRGENIAKLVIPMLFGFGMNKICWGKDSGKSAGETVKFRPPAYVFGVVWPILYILLGLSWITATNFAEGGDKNMTESFYILIVFFLTYWIYVYGCNKNKVGGVYIITLTIGSIILAMNIIPKNSRLLLTPLLTWLLIALLLNVSEVQGK